MNASNAPGRFVTYPVQEWCGSSTAGGDHKVIFLGDEAPAFPFDAEGRHKNRTLSWNEDAKTPAVELGRWPVNELWQAYGHVAGKPSRRPACRRRRYIADWRHPELERLVEIVSAWGHFPWLYRGVIARVHVGVCANSDEHRGRPGGGAPGVQVFGVRGGLTGVFAESLDRAAIGRALRARRTFATTGEHPALLVRCGAHLQGDAFEHAGPAEIDYRLPFGDAGWDEVAAFDHEGVLWRRNLHAELGFSKSGACACAGAARGSRIATAGRAGTVGSPCEAPSCATSRLWASSMTRECVARRPDRDRLSL